VYDIYYIQKFLNKNSLFPFSKKFFIVEFNLNAENIENLCFLGFIATMVEFTEVVVNLMYQRGDRASDERNHRRSSAGLVKRRKRRARPSRR